MSVNKGFHKRFESEIIVTTGDQFSPTKCWENKKGASGQFRFGIKNEIIWIDKIYKLQENNNKIIKCHWTSNACNWRSDFGEGTFKRKNNTKILKLIVHCIFTSEDLVERD